MFPVHPRFTLPKTNIAGWKIHHFDGIYKETWGFSWAMLVSGRVCEKNDLILTWVVFFFEMGGEKKTPTS